MSIDLTSLNLINDLTDGEAWLCRVADALEAGEMPSKDDIERMVDAVALLRLQADDKESPEQRRADLLRKLGFPKDSGREADRHDFTGRRMAELFWLGLVTTDKTITRIERDIGIEFSVKPRTVSNKRNQYPEKGNLILTLFKGVIAETDPRWIRAVDKYRETVNKQK